ncbi:MAG: 6-phosphofructokinase [Nanobdellota archaeon]
MDDLKGKSILIFTGGGETQVLNATLYGAIKAARENDMKVYGGLRGWESLINGSIADLTDMDIEGIQDIGGTLLKTSRTNPGNIKDGMEKIKKTIKEKGIDYLYVIGGDDTLGFARRLYEEEGIPIIAAPKTADNDLSGTYFTPGFPSAAFNMANIVFHIRRDSAIPRHRLFLVESQGGDSGWLTASSVFGNADLVVVPENEVKLQSFLELVRKTYGKNGNYGVVVVSKEAKFDEIKGDEEVQPDSFGVKRHQNVVDKLQKVISKDLGIDATTIKPGHIVRSGRSYELDRDFAIHLGKKGIELLKEGKHGYMANIEFEDEAFKTGSIPLSEVAGKENYRSLDSSYYDKALMRPTKKFMEYMRPIIDTSVFDDGWYYELIKNVHDE